MELVVDTVIELAIETVIKLVMGTYNVIETVIEMEMVI
jgi:hypothetical protein